MSTQILKEALLTYFTQDLMPSGEDNLSAACPFHQTKDGRPFSINLRRGLVHCFTCDYGKTVHKFLRDLGYAEVLVSGMLAGYTPERSDRESKGASADSVFTPTPYVGDYLLPEEVLGIFDWCPMSLVDLGFKMETLQYFDVGYDKKHTRITYPLRDWQGRLIGVVGGSSSIYPKYLVYKHKELSKFILTLPKTYDVKRSRYLWNAHRVLANRGKLPLVVVEGYKALLWVHQCGFSNVVALQTKSVSKSQADFLAQYGGAVIGMLDNDDPGRVGEEVLVDKLYQKVDELRLVNWSLFPDVSQPDGLSPEKLERALGEAQDVFTWRKRKDVVQALPGG